MDGAGSSWVAGAVIGSLASVLIVTIIVLLIIFRRRIKAKFFQPTCADSAAEDSMPLKSTEVEGCGDITISKLSYEAKKEKESEPINRTPTMCG